MNSICRMNPKTNSTKSNSKRVAKRTCAYGVLPGVAMMLAMSCAPTAQAQLSYDLNYDVYMGLDYYDVWAEAFSLGCPILLDSSSEEDSTCDQITSTTSNEGGFSIITWANTAWNNCGSPTAFSSKADVFFATANCDYDMEPDSIEGTIRNSTAFSLYSWAADCTYCNKPFQIHTQHATAQTYLKGNGSGLNHPDCDLPSWIPLPASPGIIIPFKVDQATTLRITETSLVVSNGVDLATSTIKWHVYKEGSSDPVLENGEGETAAVDCYDASPGNYVFMMHDFHYTLRNSVTACDVVCPPGTGGAVSDESMVASLSNTVLLTAFSVSCDITMLPGENQSDLEGICMVNGLDEEANKVDCLDGQSGWPCTLSHIAMK